MEVLKLKNWHYFNYSDHFYFQQKTNAFLDVSGRFQKFQEVSQSRNMFQLSVELRGSVSVLSADTF